MALIKGKLKLLKRKLKEIEKKQKAKQIAKQSQTNNHRKYQKNKVLL